MEGFETYIDVKGNAKIHFEVFGNGEPVIMLHGNGGSTRSFDKQIPSFMSEYKVICIDTRGHGKSTLGELNLDFEIIAEDVIAVMDYLDIDRANIVGFSDGGNTAIYLGIYYPSRVNSLILSGANIFPEGLVNYIKLPIKLGYGACKVGSLFSNKLKVKRELFSLMYNHPHINPDDLSRIKVPTLVMAGDKDLIKREHTNLITQRIKHSVEYIVNDCDHFIADEKPNEFNYIVMNFLNELVYNKGDNTNEKKS